MGIMNLYEKLVSGWLFPYRAKKAHYFKNRLSLCGKHTLTEYQESGLLPSQMLNRNECCKVCLKKYL